MLPFMKNSNINICKNNKICLQLLVFELGTPKKLN